MINTGKTHCDTTTFLIEKKSEKKKKKKEKRKCVLMSEQSQRDQVLFVSLIRIYIKCFFFKF
jgi:hypothetical protein